MPARYRIFNGKEYTIKEWCSTKKEAREAVDKYKKNHRYVRTVPTKNIRGDKGYTIYASR